MKKGLKYCIITCLCLIAAGSALIGIGILNGGTVSYRVDFQNRKLRTRTYNSEDYIEKTIAVDNFSKLELNVDTTDVEIRKGANYQVAYNLPEDEIPSIEVKDQTLTISGKKNVSSDFSSVCILNIGEYDVEDLNTIIITVPEDAKISEAGINVETGDIKVKDMECDTIDITGNNGDIKISNVTSEHAKLSSESGDISLNNIKLKDYTIANEYGDLKIDNSVGEKAVFDCDSVECELKNLEIDDLHMTNQYGEIKMEESTINTCEIDTESTEIKLEDCKGSTLNLEAEYNDIKIRNSVWNQVQARCESLEADIDLIGQLSEYDLDLIAESGAIDVNGKDNGEKCKDIANRGKLISIENEYGDINLSVKEK